VPGDGPGGASRVVLLKFGRGILVVEVEVQVESGRSLAVDDMSDWLAGGSRQIKLGINYPNSTSTYFLQLSR